MTSKIRKSHYVACVSNRGYPAELVTRRIYCCVSDPDAEKRGLLRVIDESGEDYLFPAGLFAAIDLPQAVERAFRKAS